MAVNINIPSQVKTYANLAAFPASGSLKTIYIAEDTNKTYRWDGSTYVEISASAATGLSVGTTPISSGTIGRVLFEGTGNVLQQSSSLAYDDTAKAFTLSANQNASTGITISNTTSGTNATATLLFQSDGLNQSVLQKFSSNSTPYKIIAANDFLIYNSYHGGDISILNDRPAGRIKLTAGSGSVSQFTIAQTGNVLINTTTDAGFRLDVNGTARVQGNTTISGADRFLIVNNTSTGLMGLIYQNAAVDQAYIGIASSNNAGLNGSLTHDYFIRSLGRRILFGTSSGIQAMLFNTGNFAINTTTDAGYKLDVNGTARIKGAGTTILDLQNSSGSTSAIFYDDLSVYINGRNNNGYTTNIRIGGQFNQANMNFFGNNNIYVGQAGVTENIPSALIAMGSTTKGFLPPRMTTTERNAIASPAAGLIVYDTTLNLPHFYNGTIWVSL